MNNHYLRSFIFLVFICGFYGSICGAGQDLSCKVDPSQLSSAPNIILITINSLRADHVGIHGYTRQTTPNFDKFARDNIWFNSAFATSSWQMPSHGSILTSLYPSEHGGTHINKKLSDSCETLPEILSQKGYYTAGFCCNPRLNSAMGFARGFDFYDDYSVEMHLDSISLTPDEKININQRRTNDLINQAAIRWLKNNNSRPFFLYLHYYDNHWDYLPPEPYRDMFNPDYKGIIDGRRISKEPLYSNPPEQEDIDHIIALYDGEVRQTDEDLGFFLQYLANNSFMKNSVIIILGEHGEQFYEHGNTSHHGLYEELIHIPMAVHLPGSKPGRYDKPVSQVDILPTILDVTGFNDSLPEGSRGISLMSVIEGKISRDWIYAEYTGGAVPDCSVLRSKRYKVFQTEGEITVYDLFKDREELKPLKKAEYDGHVRSLIDNLAIIENSRISETAELEKNN